MSGFDLPSWWQAPKPESTVEAEAFEFSEANLFAPEEEASVPDYESAPPEIKELVDLIGEASAVIDEWEQSGQ